MILKTSQLYRPTNLGFPCVKITSNLIPVKMQTFTVACTIASQKIVVAFFPLIKFAANDVNTNSAR